jgi:hypothetical protein
VGPGRRIVDSEGPRNRNPRNSGGAARGQSELPAGTGCQGAWFRPYDGERRLEAGQVSKEEGRGGGGDLGEWSGTSDAGKDGEEEASTNRGSARIRASRVAAGGSGEWRIEALVQPGVND